MKISELPEPYKSKAELRRLLYSAETTEDRIGYAFAWYLTPERENFWQAVELAETPGQLPPVPGIWQAPEPHARDITAPDPTNPDHYRQHPSGVECIEITEHMSFLLGNVIKYVWRADLKNGIEDLKKARWYIEREINRRMESDDERTLPRTVSGGAGSGRDPQHQAGWRDAVRDDPRGSDGDSAESECDRIAAKWSARLNAPDQKTWSEFSDELHKELATLGKSPDELLGIDEQEDTQ